MKNTIFAILFLLITGCASEAPPPTPVLETEGFIYLFICLPDREVSALNIWRQENYDKHVIAFSYSLNGWLIHYKDNPGNSRQVFVAEEVQCDWYAEELKRVESKYQQNEIVGFSCLHNNSRIVVYCLQDKLEPYEPSTD